MFLEVRAVGVRDCDVVEELGATEHEALPVGGGLAEDLERIVGQDAHYEVVECLSLGCGASVYAFAVVGFCAEGPRAHDYAFVASLYDLGDIGVQSDFHAFGLEIFLPILIEVMEFRESNHGW